MKTVLFIILVVALFPSAAYAGLSYNDSGMLILTAMAVTDYNQSVEAFYHREGFRELNPILGERTTRREMITFGAASILLLLGAEKILSEKWYTILLDSCVASERFNIEDNVRNANGHRRHIAAIPIIISIRW